MIFVAELHGIDRFESPRALVQACWQYRHRPAVGVGLRKRREDQPERVLAIAEKAERRLSGRYARLKARGKHVNRVVIAIARELVGFLWAALREQREPAIAHDIDFEDRSRPASQGQEKRTM